MFSWKDLAEELVLSLWDLFWPRKGYRKRNACRFKMCADVKDSLGVKSPFPVMTRDWTKLCFFPGPWGLDDGDTHTRSIDLVGVESAHSAIEKWNLKPQMQVTQLPIFATKCKRQPVKQDKSTSRDFVARGQPLRGQTRLAPLTKRLTCSKSIL